MHVLVHAKRPFHPYRRVLLCQCPVWCFLRPLGSRYCADGRRGWPGRLAVDLPARGTCHGHPGSDVLLLSDRLATTIWEVA